MKVNRLLTFLISFFFLAAPASALASVEITEIMYHPTSPQSGREWVEITNTGSGSIDVSSYKFFENNTNHGFTTVSGGTVLGAGVSAVIVEDSAKFLADYPAFAGVLLKSSFDLSDSGEPLAIKQNSTATPDDAITYDPSAGAGGDGNSLHRSGSAFVPGAPDPGMFAGSGGGSGAGSDSTTTQTQTSAQTQLQQAQTVGGMMPPPITAEITTDKISIVGGGSVFLGEVFGTQGDPIPNARFVWNFGDGATAEGQNIIHTFSYPGTYVVVLTASSGVSSTQAQVVVLAAAAKLGLIAENDGSLLIWSGASQPLDVGLWMLVCGHDSFIIPQETLVLGGGGIRFSPAITKLQCGIESRLEYPNGSLAAEARLSTDSPLRGTPVSAAQMQPPRPLNSSPKSQVPSASGVVEGTSSSIASGVSAPADATPSPLLTWLIGLGALVVLGSGAFLYTRLPAPGAAPAQPAPPETADYEEEFEIE